MTRVGEEEDDTPSTSVGSGVGAAGAGEFAFGADAGESGWLIWRLSGTNALAGSDGKFVSALADALWLIGDAPALDVSRCRGGSGDGSVISPGCDGGGIVDGGGRSGSVLRGRGTFGAECELGASGFSVVDEVR